MNWSELTGLLGWAIIVNIVMIFFSMLLLIAARQTLIKIHQQWFNLPQSQLLTLYVYFLAGYKLLNLCLFVAPWLALKIMGY